MIVLPVVISTLSAIGGMSGLALSVKGLRDQLNADTTNRYVQEQNERNLLRFEEASKRTDQEFNALGKQRLAISKNFAVFVKAFEKIHNKPEFSSIQDPGLTAFDFDEIESVSIFADADALTAAGAVAGSVFGAAAASGTNSALWAIGKAQLGQKAARLHGVAKKKAILAALGGGAKRVGGGGIALGKMVLNAASLGTSVLIEGIALAYSASLAKKNADEAKKELRKNEEIIYKAIEMQLDLAVAAEKLREVSVRLCNGTYKKLVLQFKALVDEKTDWKEFTAEERKLVENCVLAVQLLHSLNNVPLYKVTKCDAEGKIESVEPNFSEVYEKINYAKTKA